MKIDFKAKMELAIQKMIVRAEKEIAEGNSIPLDDAIAQLRARINSHASNLV